MPHISAFLLTVFAGLSTLIGTLVILIPSRKKIEVIASSLSFAAGVMITVSLTDLLPNAWELFKTEFFPFPAFLLLGIFMTLGILTSMFIDFYLPDSEKTLGKNKTLYRVGLISMLAIILHNIPEGIATYMAGTSDIHLGISLAIAIALHNIPEGISISIPLYYATGSKKKAFFYTFISGISEPLGAILAFLFLGPLINNFIMGMLFSLIAGIMLHISFYELLPTAKKYCCPKLSFLFFGLGVIFMLLNHFIFG